MRWPSISYLFVRFDVVYASTFWQISGSTKSPALARAPSHFLRGGAEMSNSSISQGRGVRRGRGTQRRMALLGIVTILSLLVSLFPQVVGQPMPTASAHNLQTRMVYMFFDHGHAGLPGCPHGRHATACRLCTAAGGWAPGQPLLQPNDEVGLIIKVVPRDGTTTGVGGHIDFYVPNGVRSSTRPTSCPTARAASPGGHEGPVAHRHRRRARSAPRPRRSLSDLSDAYEQLGQRLHLHRGGPGVRPAPRHDCRRLRRHRHFLFHRPRHGLR